MRKRMYLIPGALILFILYFTVFGEKGLLRIHRLNQEKQDIQNQLDELNGENEKLRREIEALKTDRRYLESIARKDFGLVRPNEVIYYFPSSAKTAAAVKQPAAPSDTTTNRVRH